LAETRITSSQVRCSATTTGTKALRAAISLSARSCTSGARGMMVASRASTARTSLACSRTIEMR
jgi:hypothetical protein